MEKHRNKFTIIFLVVATLVIAGLAIFASRIIQNQTTIKSDIASGITPSPEPPKDEIVDYPSPDGKYTLTMKNKKGTDGVVHQTFSVTSDKNETPVVIYEKDSSLANLISVPDNSFSPTNKYIFLTYQESNKSRYIVLRTDGEDIKKDNKTIEFSSLFDEQYPDFVITDVTGWGGYGLIVINTDNLDGKAGPSWWFDVTNSSFIRLSTRFN